MDATQQSIVSITALALSVAGTVLGIINHKRCRSRSVCCGTEQEVGVSLDIDSTTPPSNVKPFVHFQESPA